MSAEQDDVQTLREVNAVLNREISELTAELREQWEPAHLLNCPHSALKNSGKPVCAGDKDYCEWPRPKWLA